jgi:NADH-quinone oxidoreductase subunit C
MPASAEARPVSIDNTRPSIPRLGDPARDPELTARQEAAALEATSLDVSDDHPPREEVPETDGSGAPTRVEGDVDLAALLRDEFGATEVPKEGAPVVPVDRHVALAQRLKAMGLRIFVHVVATHFPAKSGAQPRVEGFEVAYALRSVGKGSRLVSWRLRIDAGQNVPSLVGLFAGADWQEREQFDLVGVRFEGHPDLRRILLPADWKSHPLRKDFAADAACAPWR